MKKEAHTSAITPEELANGRNFKACVISFFDGMLDHHWSLLQYARKLADGKTSDVLVILCTYKRQKSRTNKLSPVLLSPDERWQMLREAGYQHVMHLTISPDYQIKGYPSLPADTDLLLKHNEVLIPGADTLHVPGFPELFKALEAQAKNCGASLDRQFFETTVSSHDKHTAMVHNGRMTAFLDSTGYAFPVGGHVVKGNMIGHTLGYPTANLRVGDPLKMVPAQGVYVGMVSVGKAWYQAMINIGIRPTLDMENVTIEAHLFDFEQDIYGEWIRVAFLERTRDEMRFSSLGELKLQLDRDKVKAKEVLAGCLGNTTANAFIHRKPIRWS